MCARYANHTHVFPDISSFDRSGRGGCFLVIPATSLLMDNDLMRLGRFVQARRMEKGWATREDFTKQLSFSYRVVTDLENGKRTLGTPAYREIESILDWETGSVDDVLDGGRPHLRLTAEEQRHIDSGLAADYSTSPARAAQTPLDHRFDALDEAARSAREYVAAHEYGPALNQVELATSLGNVLADDIRRLSQQEDRDDLDTSPESGTSSPKGEDEKMLAADDPKPRRDLRGAQDAAAAQLFRNGGFEERR